MFTTHGSHYPAMDKKTMEKAMRDLLLLSKLSNLPILHRSHPYLPDIARDTREQLYLILQKTSGFELAQNQYLQVTVPSLLRKASQSNEILIGASAALNGQQTSARRNLTKLSLIFSHILCELKALFPGGKYQGNAYRVTKPEAAKFWTKAFGKKCLVKWGEFRTKLNSVHPVGAGPLESALRSTMDLTCNDHVSVFEFDIFTRLFQPWETLLQNWMLLAVTHPGYMAFLTYDEVRVHLQSHIQKPGSYIFRLSCTHLGQWAIGYVRPGGEILQTIPHNKSLNEALQEGEKEGLYLYPNGLSTNPDLTELCRPTPNSSIHVTQEQWDLYSQMDSTFELCKICADNEKNVRIQPCGHLLCNQCLTAWQQSDGLTCPFCRCEIRGKEDISIVPQPVLEEAAAAAPATPSAPAASPDTSDSSPSLSSDVTHEEEEWIRNRPLPTPPGSSDTISDSEPSTSIASSPSNALSVPSAPMQSTRSSPLQRLKIQAFDIINARSETLRSSKTRGPQVPPRP
ncbi:E3 ubiquitin-protein ligase CBL-C [Rhinophrynus dorsalis]